MQWNPVSQDGGGVGRPKGFLENVAEPKRILGNRDRWRAIPYQEVSMGPHITSYITRSIFNVLSHHRISYHKKIKFSELTSEVR